MSTPETITDLADVKAGDVVTARFVETGETITATAHHPDDTPAGWVSLLGWTLSKGNGKFGLGIKKFELISVRRPVPPAPAPGTVGRATVCDVKGVRVVWTGDEDGLPWWQMPTPETRQAYRGHAEVTDFVPDADTAALRAEVERLKVADENLIRAQQIEEEARLWEQRRADAAEARLARVTALLDAPGGGVSCAGLDLTTSGCFAHDLAVRIRAIVAGDEQAGVSSEVSPTLARAGEQETRGEAWPFKPGAVLDWPEDPQTVWTRWRRRPSGT